MTCMEFTFVAQNIRSLRRKLDVVLSPSFLSVPFSSPSLLFLSEARIPERLFPSYARRAKRLGFDTAWGVAPRSSPTAEVMNGGLVAFARTPWTLRRILPSLLMRWIDHARVLVCVCMLAPTYKMQDPCRLDLWLPPPLIPRGILCLLY